VQRHRGHIPSPMIVKHKVASKPKFELSRLALALDKGRPRETLGAKTDIESLLRVLSRVNLNGSCPNNTLKVPRKLPAQSFVQPSKIFAWEA
jgi:hypothetical protein